MLITLVERGRTVAIDALEFDLLANDPHLCQLADRGIFAVKAIGSQKGIEPRKYVGRASTSAGMLEIQPRHKKLFDELVNIATAYSIRRVVGSGSPFQAGDGVGDLSPHLLRAWNDACSVGLPIVYLARTVTSSVARGPILMSQTIGRLASRGVKHKVVTRYKERHVDADIESVLFTCIQLVRLTVLMSRTDQDLAHRLLSIVQHAQSTLAIGAAAETCDALLLRYPDWPELQVALDLAKRLLVNESVVWHVEVSNDSGESNFCDVDRLWEQVVWAGFRLELGHLDVRFHPCANGGLNMMTESSRTMDPDIVIYRGDKPSIVVDAKYSVSVSAESGDIYQILAYGHRLDADVAVLVYLSDESWFERVGRDGQLVVFAIGVPGVAVMKSLRALVAELKPYLPSEA